MGGQSQHECSLSEERARERQVCWITYTTTTGNFSSGSGWNLNSSSSTAKRMQETFCDICDPITDFDLFATLKPLKEFSLDLGPLH